MREERRLPLLFRLMGRASGRYLSHKEYLTILAEDMAVLLNTRAPCRSETTASVLEYGLADCSTAGPDGLAVAGAVLRTLERFEPRLKQIRVQPCGVEGSLVYLHVEAISEKLPVAFLLQCDGGVFLASMDARD